MPLAKASGVFYFRKGGVALFTKALPRFSLRRKNNPQSWLRHASSPCTEEPIKWFIPLHKGSLLILFS